MKYRAILSSDWNECLAPCGPFDAVSFNYPELAPQLDDIFCQYTANKSTLGQAARHIEGLLPAPLSEQQMDAYLKRKFATYTGVPELIAWCRQNDVLFMINTTGMLGYFQRVCALGLLPPVPVLSAHPLIRYAGRATDPSHLYELLEIGDKAANTERALERFQIPSHRVILVGDSGGDGPHFAWGAQSKAFLIGSMTKPSLYRYCRQQGIHIDLEFGLSYAQGQARSPQAELEVDFMDLVPVIEKVIRYSRGS